MLTSPALRETTSSSRRVATVVAGAAGAGWIATAGLLSRNEQAAAAIPIGCPFKAITGLDCPGCGSTRSLGALTRLDLPAAFDHHVFVPVVLVFVVASYVAWTIAVWRRPWDESEPTARFVATDLVRRPSITLAIAFVLVVFTVTRNLEMGEWLASSRLGP